MIELGIARGPDPAERRNYSSLILGAIEAAALGGGSPAAAWARSAACEIACLFWSRLATATVEPRNRRTAALTPLTVAAITRRMARSGEYLAVLDVRDGRLQLDEAWEWFVTGRPRRDSWIYRVTQSGPSFTETRTLPADEVCHVRYAWFPEQPWRGASPAAFASNGSGLAGGIDTTLAGEANSPAGYVMPAADLGADAEDDDADPFVKMRGELAALKGGLTIAPTQKDALGRGAEVRLSSAPIRIRPARGTDRAPAASARGRARGLRDSGVTRGRTRASGGAAGSGADVSGSDVTGARGHHRGTGRRGDRTARSPVRVPDDLRYQRTGARG